MDNLAWKWTLFIHKHKNLRNIFQITNTRLQDMYAVHSEQVQRGKPRTENRFRTPYSWSKEGVRNQFSVRVYLSVLVSLLCSESNFQTQYFF